MPRNRVIEVNAAASSTTARNMMSSLNEDGEHSSWYVLLSSRVVSTSFAASVRLPISPVGLVTRPPPSSQLAGLQASSTIWPSRSGHAAVHARGELDDCGSRSSRRGRTRAPSCVSASNTWSDGVRVEIAGRLVGQQHARRVGDRAGDGDALLLAAGQFRRPVRRAARRGRDSSAVRAARSRASRARRPRIICGSMTFSSAENSGSR